MYELDVNDSNWIKTDIITMRVLNKCKPNMYLKGVKPQGTDQILCLILEIADGTRSPERRDGINYRQQSTGIDCPFFS